MTSKEIVQMLRIVYNIPKGIDNNETQPSHEIGQNTNADNPTLIENYTNPKFSSDRH